jgi:hypothetical protein
VKIVPPTCQGCQDRDEARRNERALAVLYKRAETALLDLLGSHADGGYGHCACGQCETIRGGLALPVKGAGSPGV